jgi:hypothetical protein
MIPIPRIWKDKRYGIAYSKQKLYRESGKGCWSIFRFLEPTWEGIFVINMKELGLNVDKVTVDYFNKEREEVRITGKEN